MSKTQKDRIVHKCSDVIKIVAMIEMQLERMITEGERSDEDIRLDALFLRRLKTKAIRYNNLANTLLGNPTTESTLEYVLADFNKNREFWPSTLKLTYELIDKYMDEKYTDKEIDAVSNRIHLMEKLTRKIIIDGVPAEKFAGIIGK